jgi:hypothetical protein
MSYAKKDVSSGRTRFLKNAHIDQFLEAPEDTYSALIRVGPWLINGAINNG